MQYRLAGVEKKFVHIDEMVCKVVNFLGRIQDRTNVNK